MGEDELMQIVKEGFESEKMRILAKVEEELESAKTRMFTKLKRYFKDGNQTSSARTNMKLELRNGIAQTILTGEEIKGEGGVPIEVALVDGPAGDVVDAEPEASANVEIVLLKGEPSASEGDDWTAEDFNANIVPQVEGKLPILAGNVALQLKKGVGVVENIRFRNHASKIKPSKFKLGLRVVGASDGGCRIKEAKTEPFTLKDFRAKYYKKHENPSLSDEVPRLVNIRKGGEIDKRLQVNKIFTVEDFLIQLLINAQGLKSIVNSQPKKWEATVSNARACLSGERVYFYMDMKQKTGAIFNILGQVLGLYSERYYSQTSTLSEKQKADAEKLLASAYENWGEVKAFDDEDSARQHFACLSTYMDHSDSLKPDCPDGGLDNTGAPEMVAESSSRRSNASFHSACSAMDLFGETSGQDLESFSTVTDNMGIMYDYDPVMQHNHAWPCSPCLFEGVDECIQQICGCSLMNESNGAATTAESAEPQVVSTRNRWKKLFCLLTWLIRKRASVDDNPRRKKQKVD